MPALTYVWFVLLATVGQQGPAGLWLTELSPTRATVSLRLAPDENAEFLVGVRGGELKPRSVSKDGNVGVVRLTGLSPETTYEVRCGWRRTSFRTLDPSRRRLRVAVVGHTGGTRVARHHPWEVLAARLEELAPDFVVHAGDTAEHCGEHYFTKAFFEVFDRVLRRIPIYVAPGNHEGASPHLRVDYSEFRRCFPYPFDATCRTGAGPAYYVISRGAVRFIMLTYFPNALQPGSDQRKWLAEELKKDACTFTILVLGMNQSTFSRDDFLKSLPRGRVDLVIGGDGNGTWLRDLHGVPVLFNGSGDGGPHPNTLLEIDPHRIMLNTFSGSTRIVQSRVLHDQHRYTPVVDLLDRFTEGICHGGEITKGSAGVVLALAKNQVYWIARPGPIVPLARVRGIQIELSRSAPSNPMLYLYVRWYIVSSQRGTLEFRSQPIAITECGRRLLISEPIPDVDVRPGEKLSLKGLALQVEQHKTPFSKSLFHAIRLF